MALTLNSTQKLNYMVRDIGGIASTRTQEIEGQKAFEFSEPGQTRYHCVTLVT